SSPPTAGSTSSAGSMVRSPMQFQGSLSAAISRTFPAPFTPISKPFDALLRNRHATAALDRDEGWRREVGFQRGEGAWAIGRRILRPRPAGRFPADHPALSQPQLEPPNGARRADRCAMDFPFRAVRAVAGQL